MLMNHRTRSRVDFFTSSEGADGSLSIFQDARIYDARLSKGTKLSHPLSAGRRAWLQLARGAVTLNGTKLVAGDGAAVQQEIALDIAAEQDSELLLFDLP